MLIRLFSLSIIVHSELFIEGPDTSKAVLGSPVLIRTWLQALEVIRLVLESLGLNLSVSAIIATMLLLFRAVELAIIYYLSLHGTVQRRNFNSCISSV